MNNNKQLPLKKSLSSYDKSQTFYQANPEQRIHTNKGSSHVQEMIFQKYNFVYHSKTNACERKAKYQKIKKNSFSFGSNVIVMTQFPQIKPNNSVNSRQILLNSQKIGKKQEQNSVEICNYTFIKPPQRKIIDYKDCIKRIQMKTTYRGFNFTKNKFYKKNTNPQNRQVQIGRSQHSNKISLKGAERKRIIQYIIQKGFARKMQDSLIRVRDERKKVRNELLYIKNTENMSPFGGKKSVIFSQTESVVLGSDFKGKRMDGKEQSIEPW